MRSVAYIPEKPRDRHLVFHEPPCGYRAPVHEKPGACPWVFPVAFAFAAALSVGGCLKVNTRIVLHPDGSATVTERVRLSNALLDLDAEQTGGVHLADVLTKAAAERRMKQMGEGVRLASHRIDDVEESARESVAVFEVADISKFTYASPFLAYGDYPQTNVLKCELFPVYESTWYGRRAGQMAIQFKSAGPRPRDRSGETPPPPPAPAAQQVFRDLQPVFRDMLSGFQAKLMFESYAPIRCRQYYRYRNMRAGTHEFPLMDFADTNMDQYAGPFLGNEEVMLELLRGKVGGPNVIENTAGHADNVTLPVYHPTGVPEIYFNPSKELFDRYFAGKTLDFGERDGGKKPAKFEEIGYKPMRQKPAGTSDTP
jgi:hypothetical protein